MNDSHSADALKPQSRAEFEAHIRAKAESEEYATLILQRNGLDEYSTVWVQAEWNGWQAAWSRRPTPASDLCADLNAERINTTPASPDLDNEAAARLRKQAEEAKKVRGVVALSPEDAFALLGCLERAEADVAALRKEHDSYQRMFTAACEDLGAINEALNLDPNDGGAEPILEAIKELRERAEVVLSGFANSESPNNNAEFGVAAAGAVPEGFALVPLNPHVPQVAAGHRADPYAHHVTDIYTAMIAAAPPAQGLPAAPKKPYLSKFATLEEYKAAMREYEAATTPAAAPETCQCPDCLTTGLHASGCAVHNAPAYPNGPCDCRAPAAAPSEAKPVARARVLEDCECGCNDPVATDPIGMLEFLANRFELAGVAHAVAQIYAHDIRKILATPPAQDAGTGEPRGARIDDGGCPCWKCIDERGGMSFSNNWMVLCAICGNKRCPHAKDHRNACTNSNEPGQKGSAYENCAIANSGRTE